MRFIAVFSAVLFFSLFATNTEVLGIATYTVNTTADTAPDGCSGAPGGCTLREALIAANSSVGPDQINFNIPGAGVRQITLLSDPPLITESVTIDGLTQPGAFCDPESDPDRNLLISIIGELDFGMNVAGANTTIRGLAISTFATQIILGGTGGHKLECNNIGVNPSGTAWPPQPFEGGQAAVKVVPGSHGNTIGGDPEDRNLIFGYGGVDATEVNNLTVKGNQLGLFPLPGEPIAGSALTLSGASTGITVEGNGFFSYSKGLSILDFDEQMPAVTVRLNGFTSSLAVGIDVPLSGNQPLLIEANGFTGAASNPNVGIDIRGGHMQTTIRSNTFVENLIGIRAVAAGFTIGGPTILDRNVFNGPRTAMDLYINEAVPPLVTTVQGNLLMPSNGPVPPAWSERTGIALSGYVGGLPADVRIIGNEIRRMDIAGIAIRELGGVRVEGNFIGVSGGVTEPNAIGVLVRSAQHQGIIDIGPGNYITSNTTAGVQLIDSKNVRVWGNTIGLTPIGENPYFSSQPVGVSILGGSGNEIGAVALGTTPNNIARNSGPGILAVDTLNLVVAGNIVHNNGGAGMISTATTNNSASGNVYQNIFQENGGPGIQVDGVDHVVTIDTNRYFDNAGLAIDLTPNGLFAYIVIDWVQAADGQVTVMGAVTTHPEFTGYIDFYVYNECRWDGTGQGEYANFFVEPFTTDENGNYQFSLTAFSSLGPGLFLSAVLREGPSPGAGESSEFSQCQLIVSDSAPTLTSLMVRSITRGSNGFSQYAYGSNFTPGSVAYWNGEARTTQVLDANTLLFQVETEDIANTGLNSVTVVNPAVTEPEPRAAEGSNPIYFPVLAASRSDINCSGFVGAEDALRLMQVLAGLDGFFCNLDVDGDADGDIADVIYVRKVVAGLLPE